MFRVALLSDIHGNVVALDAVLADIAARGAVDAIWVLGDLVALGPEPVAVLDRLTALDNVVYTHGNTDLYVVRPFRPLPEPDAIRADPIEFRRYANAALGVAWTRGAVVTGGYFEWLGQLPLEMRLTLPDGTRLLGVHARPGTADGFGISPATTPEELAELLDGCGADLVCVGHTHTHLDVRSGSVRAFNLGSVSNPFPPDLRASYAWLEADSTGYTIEQRLVDYDREAVIARLNVVGHPSAPYLTRQLRGENQPPWAG